MDPSRQPKLSICILTVNRAALIGDTLESIVSQATDDCEIVVLDSASTDGTQNVVLRYAQRFKGLRYIRKDIDGGLDEDRDEAVALSKGEYCWFLSSKDLMKDNAIPSVLKALRPGVGAVIVNMEIWNHEMSVKLVESALTLEADSIYKPGESDALFKDSFNSASHFSCTIIRKDIWQAIDKTKFYGSQSINLVTLFKEPMSLDSVVLAKPMIKHRFGSPSWGHNATRFALLWNPMVESLALSRATKDAYRQSRVAMLTGVLHLRAWGWYSFAQYRSVARPLLTTRRERIAWMLVSVLPQTMVVSLLMIRCKLSRHHDANLELEMLRRSPHHIRI